VSSSFLRHYDETKTLSYIKDLKTQLSLTTYNQLRASIEPGLSDIQQRIPILTNGRPIKIASARVGGRNFLRLIIGQFVRQSVAAAECQQALLLIDFCEVIAFEGEDY